MADDFRVFISAVTSEFGKARSEVASDLRARGAIVHVQSDFTQGGSADTLLERLHDYIRDCNAVVCIIGKQTGESPPAAAATAFEKMLPIGVAQASYTQWEIYFTSYYKRRLYIHVARDDYIPDKEPPDFSDEAQDALVRQFLDEAQDAFVRRIKAAGKYWTSFSQRAELRIAVLREQWPRPLPTDPKPGPKPVVVLPYPSLGPLFKGREAFMRQLHESLSRNGQTAIISKALYGLGGIGKTRAAVEYAWAHRRDYSALLFVVADSPYTLRHNLAGLCPAVIPDYDEKQASDEQRLQAVIDWLDANPSLLILDNVDTKEALTETERMLSQLASCQIIVTSRLADFSANFQPLILDLLGIDDAVTFLLARTQGRRRNAVDDAIMAREIVIELGQLALALEHAAAYVAKHKLTFGGYLKRWHSAQHDSVLNWFDETVTGYPRAVAVTWQTSVAQLTASGRRLLERLAWLAPEKIPEFLLDIPIFGAGGENLHDALSDLATYSLVTRDTEEPYFLVHRLVQDVTRRSMGTVRHQRQLEALKWIDAAYPIAPDEVQSWLRIHALSQFMLPTRD